MAVTMAGKKKSESASDSATDAPAAAGGGASKWLLKFGAIFALLTAGLAGSGLDGGSLDAAWQEFLT